MAARPRIRKRAHYPPNLHEPRPGYFTWRDPRDGKTHIIGRVTAAEAIHEAQQANLVAERGIARKSLAERLESGRETVSDLLDKMPTEGLKANTLKARADYDRTIKAEIGSILCEDLTTKHIADMLEGIKARGKNRWAQAIRSRIFAACTKGVALGWMQTNPAAVTEKVKVKVKRQRLSMEQFQKILDKAPEVAAWLPNAMLLALITGQDRSTIAGLQRSNVVGDYLVLQRSKTDVVIEIPLALRMDAIGLSLADVIAKCKTTGVVSKHLIHHIRPYTGAPSGAPVDLDTISKSFAKARVLAGLVGDTAPTFHELRSLAKRTYMEQTGVDTKALLGHQSDQTADIYANPRGIAPIRVKVAHG